MELLTGNEIVLRAAIKAGAEAFYGYPITPTTEILTGWAKTASENKNLIFRQTEDETAAGFGVIGSSLAGRKSWTATAAIGHVLMQDPLSAAEAMRIPFVLYVGQRGGPSTGTVIYSQQELNLARFGGNGEGLRVILAPSNLTELYTLTIKAFNIAWEHRLPVIILSDGYLSKMTGTVEFEKTGRNITARPTLFGEEPVNLRNCYSQEAELGQVLSQDLKSYAEISKKVEVSETIGCADAEIVVFAWGTVGEAAKEAQKTLRKEGAHVGVFRPITLKPFGATAAKQAIKKASQILICEAAAGQFGRLVTESLFGNNEINVERLYKPAEGITADEIISKVREML